MGRLRFSEYLTETTMSRVWQHATDLSESIGLLTAFTRDHSEADNIQQAKTLAGRVQTAGYGYLWVDGHYTLNDIPVSEPSILVIGNTDQAGRLKGYLRQWRTDFNQESVLYRPAGDLFAYLLYANQDVAVGPIHPDRVGEYMTTLRGREDRNFAFAEAFEEKNFFGRWGLDLPRR